MLKKKNAAAAILVASGLLLNPAYSAEFSDEPPAFNSVPGAERERDGGDGPGARAERMIDDALQLIGLRYRRGGSSVETGFDCSGFVRHVVREALGLVLPRTSREMSREGEPIDKADLQPGDLVFFNTMRRAFSHVGIYLGNNRFVHAPRSGRTIRIEDMSDRYWTRRYNGARRIEGR